MAGRDDGRSGGRRSHGWSDDRCVGPRRSSSGGGGGVPGGDHHVRTRQAIRNDLNP